MKARWIPGLLAVIGTALTPAATHPAGAVLNGSPTAAAWPFEVERLVSAAAVIPVLPEDAEGALVRAVESLGAALGVPVAAGDAIAAAKLPPGTAGRLALLAETLLTCHSASAPARVAAAAGGSSTVPVAARSAMRACAADLQSIAVEAGAHLRDDPAAVGGALDVWPVLRYSPGAADDRYVHDYALVVDEGGSDTYLNSAGGSLLDLQRGPDGSAAVKQEPARGCHTLGLDFVAGKGPTDGQCYPAVAVLIDSAGDDTYSALESPDPADDAFCTGDPLVRRIVTGGAGFAGVGVLIDKGGNDRYLGKTVALGGGHLAGVGILRDEGGDDSYVALRNAQGYALAGGVGILKDQGGDDTFDYYELGALDPTAPFQRPGSGGVVDDAGLCDNLPRQVQGTALLPGSYGVLVNEGGADSYRGAPPATQPDPTTPTPHGSQGYGGSGGVGYFLDEGGRDAYQGVPNRYDDLVVNPSAESSGIFEDRGSIEGGESGTPR